MGTDYRLGRLLLLMGLIAVLPCLVNLALWALFDSWLISVFIGWPLALLIGVTIPILGRAWACAPRAPKRWTEDQL